MCVEVLFYVFVIDKILEDVYQTETSDIMIVLILEYKRAIWHVDGIVLNSIRTKLHNIDACEIKAV